MQGVQSAIVRSHLSGIDNWGKRRSFSGDVLASPSPASQLCSINYVAHYGIFWSTGWGLSTMRYKSHDRDSAYIQ